MKKLSYILLIVILGSFFVPNETHVCGAANAKTCCEKEISAPKVKNCCKKTALINNTKKNCNGKCNHQNCNISSIQNFVIVPEIFKIKYNFKFDCTKKIKFFDIKSDISSGFNFIWIPPALA